MSFSACDFLEACDHAADAYDVPPLPVSTLEEMGIPTDEGYIQEEDEQQRALAERVTRALRQRAALLTAAEKVANALEGWMEIADEEDQRDGDYEALAEVRLAIEAAKAGT